MQAFTSTRGVLLPIAQDDVDTDTILPQRWLITVSREGLGEGLFGAWRYDAAGRPRPDFVLNQPAYARARIVVSGQNYGCGSSREHAVWAHLDQGISAVIAVSFGPIFYDNCLKNGLLPVRLPEAAVADLLRNSLASPGAEAEVDLVSQQVTAPDGTRHAFDIDPGRRADLLAGRDEIDATMAHNDAISAFQARQQRAHPWMTRRNEPA